MDSWPLHGSGIIMSTAWGRGRPAITRNSRTLSKIAESLPPSSTMGRIFLRSGTSGGSHSASRARIHDRVHDVGIHRLDLVRREHPLIDEGVGREARQVEEPPLGHVGAVDGVLHALANDVEGPLELPVVLDSRVPPDEDLPDDGLDGPGGRPA